MRAEQEALYQKMAQEAAAMQKKTLMEKQHVQSQAVELTTKPSKQITLHLEIFAELEAEKEACNKQSEPVSVIVVL